jgi:hypothetical protein
MADADRSVDLHMSLPRHRIADDCGHLTLVVAHGNFNWEAVKNNRALRLAIELEALPAGFGLEADPPRHVSAERPP